MQPTEWRKSTFSQGGGTDCVEVSFGQVQAAVRDSKNTAGPQLLFPFDAWRSFVTDSWR